MVEYEAYIFETEVRFFQGVPLCSYSLVVERPSDTRGIYVRFVLAVPNVDVV